MAFGFLSRSGRGAFVATSLVSAALCAGTMFACSGKSDDTDFKRRGTGGDAGAGGSAQGGSSGASGGTGGSSGGAGGRAMGGDAGSAAASGGTGGSTDAGSGGMDRGGSGGVAQGGAGGEPDDCTGGPTEAETRRYGQRATSSGWSGTDNAYAELYDVPCASVDDCLDPCAMRGGTGEMCAASICVDSTSDYCLPATVWHNLGALRSEGTDQTDGAELVLVFDPYQDYLLVDDFKLEVPADAQILGITVTIRRAGGSSMEAVDGAVRLIKGGVIGASDRSLPTPWAGPEYVNADYGGARDLWGQTWTPADVNAANFGVALSAIYTDTAGNGRAYVDIVYVTIHYQACG